MAQNRYTRFVGALYVINIVSQALFTLVIPIALGVLASYLLVRFASAPEWIYALLVTGGALSGLYGMVKFVLGAMASLERLEKEQGTKRNTGKKDDEK